jgi:peroxiredoxin
MPDTGAKESPVNPPIDTRRRPRWLRWLRDIAVLLLVFGAIQWWQARNLVVGNAPPLAGHLVDGAAFQLDAAQGPYLVHFWATWCPICRIEQDSISSIAGDRPVITVATTSGDTDEVAAYLADHRLAMPVLMDEDGEIARAWGVNGVPATFVIDTAGAVRHAGMGFSTEAGLRLRLWLAQ